MIGFVIGSDRLAGRPSAVRMLDAVNRAVAAHDAGLMLITGADQPAKALRNFTSDGRLSGVLIRAMAADYGWVREFPAANVPTVMIGRHRSLQDVHVVEIENIESTASLVGSMFDAGCERLATITGPLGRLDAEHRLEGFRLAHVQRGRSCDASLIFTGDYTRRGSFALADQVLDSHPDGIFAANDEMARGIIDRAQQRGIAIPGDVMVAGFDGVDDVASGGQVLASVCQPWDEIATVAVQTLLGLVSGMAMPLERLVDPRVKLGATVLPPLRSSAEQSSGSAFNRAVREDLA